VEWLFEFEEKHLQRDGFGDGGVNEPERLKLLAAANKKEESAHSKAEFGGAKKKIQKTKID
jgi:hypothetical protein